MPSEGKDYNDNGDEYLASASTPDYLGSALAYFGSRPLQQTTLTDFTQRHASEFSETIEVEVDFAET